METLAKANRFKIAFLIRTTFTKANDKDIKNVNDFKDVFISHLEIKSL